jgi:probable rRNA maturation factor
VNINFFNEDVSVKISQKNLKKWIRFTIEKEGFICGNLSFVFCSDEYLLKINKEYLSHDYYTDVVTFDYVEDKKISGDIFISVDRVMENADEYKVSFKDELDRVIIHGVLHLLGFKDKSQSLKKKMTEKEDEYLSVISKF